MKKKNIYDPFGYHDNCPICLGYNLDDSKCCQFCIGPHTTGEYGPAYTGSVNFESHTNSPA